MANEFYYCISLSIIHPSVDPRRITNEINILRPKIESMAGNERKVRGETVYPQRKVALTHWLADLNGEEKIYSGNIPISNFIFEQLIKLERFKNLFFELRKEGQVVFLIGWYSETNYSTGEIKAETMKKCGDLGIDIEINFYFGH